jgi:hypothetical protein
VADESKVFFSAENNSHGLHYKTLRICNLWKMDKFCIYIL